MTSLTLAKRVTMWNCMLRNLYYLVSFSYSLSPILSAPVFQYASIPSPRALPFLGLSLQRSVFLILLDWLWVSQQCCFSRLVCVRLRVGRWPSALSPPAVSQPSVHNWLLTWEYTAALGKERQKASEGRGGSLRVLITAVPFDRRHNERRKGSVVRGMCRVLEDLLLWMPQVGGFWVLGEQQVVIGMRISSYKSPYSEISPALKSPTSFQFSSSSHTH